MLPDSQPQSAPEIALIQSRMILGKTVDDLNLQTIIKNHIFRFLDVVLQGSLGKNEGSLSISRLYVHNVGNDSVKLKLTVRDGKHYEIDFNNKK